MRKLIALSVIAVTMVATSSAQAKSKAFYTHDFITATNIVGKFYGRLVENWLVNCSSSEGGHGQWVWYGHNRTAIFGANTPGGWMQFMESTWNKNMKWSFQDALKRGLRANSKARSYYEPLGQAIVAAAMYFRDRNSDRTWTGSQC